MTLKQYRSDGTFFYSNSYIFMVYFPVVCYQAETVRYRAVLLGFFLEADHRVQQPPGDDWLPPGSLIPNAANLQSVNKKTIDVPVQMSTHMRHMSTHN